MQLVYNESIAFFMEYINEEEEEQVPLTPEEYLAERKRSIRKKSWWGIGIGLFIIGAHIFLFAIVIFSEQAEQLITWKDLFKSIFFILGIFAVVGGFIGLSEAKNLAIQDLVPSPEAIAFSQQIQFIKPYFSYVLVGSIIAVTIVQSSVELESAVDTAGLIKPLVWENNEWWRILTSGTLHAGLLHILFNGYALNGFGNLIEFLSNRAHLAIVFLLAIIGGGLFSLVNYESLPSIGASGGIMGLIGYLAVYGFRRRRQLMPGFLKAMLTNIGFIAAFGLVAYQIIDNFAHMGGLIVGAVYGYLQIPRNLRENPREVSSFLNLLGLAALTVFVAASVLSILLLLKIVEF
jgi:membrane associated rhomboid family serine protease